MYCYINMKFKFYLYRILSRELGTPAPKFFGLLEKVKNKYDWDFGDGLGHLKQGWDGQDAGTRTGLEEPYEWNPAPSPS